MDSWIDPQATTVPPPPPDPDLELYLTTRWCTVYPMFTLGLQYFLYGLYVLLFTTYVQIMRHKTPGESMLYLKPTILLFVLAMFLIVVQSIYLPRQAFVKFQAIRTGDYDRLDDYLIGPDALKTACYTLSDMIEVLIKYTCFDTPGIMM
ncbi:hypothetical protein Moror_3491 [Moniliophthora roreri MCA 2997]|uniref:Uncharacterized protein n=1 Tax=Moniliophthora roreri (strain MCA 2997) TaxID=1381753 RepID=V2WPK0_MONRO|nr:hypothetical protein Moror_3491 [Moniliophthora roreri MCA 2997]